MGSHTIRDSKWLMADRGVAFLKSMYANCGDMFNAFMQPKRGHLQIAQFQIRRRLMRRLIRVCAICQNTHILGNGGQYSFTSLMGALRADNDII